MKRIAVALTLVAMLCLVHAREVLAGGSLAGTPPPPTSGPAISATIVTDPTFGSPTLGQTSVRLSKGPSSSGATFVHLAVYPVNPGYPLGWHRGCDGEHGVDPAVADQPGGFPTGVDTVATLTDRRFLGKSLFSWIPPDVVTALLDGPNVDSPGISGPSLGIQLGPLDNPVITDIDNAVCTAAGTWTDASGGVHQKYILSFTAVIQFEK